MRYLLSVIAMVIIIEGIPYFVFPKKFKEIVKLLEEMEDASLRFLGLFLMVLGLILLYLSNI